MRIKHLAMAVLWFSMGCATAGSAGKTDRNPNVITREEIAAGHVYTAYDAVQTLRPAFFHSHGQTTLSGSDTGLPRVYLNHQLFGDIESLKQLDVSAIREIHYYSAPEAANRFGLGNASGAIEVTTDAR